MKKMIIGVNWKIYMDSGDKINNFIEEFKNNIKYFNTSLLEVYILPDFLSFKIVAEGLKDFPIMMGTQDIFWKDCGAYTGEVSPAFLASIGGNCVFIGHSERKQYFGETNVTINKKVLACYRNKLVPLILVGETREQREQGLTLKTVKKQIQIALKGIPEEFMSKVVLIYEPVWAIGQKESAPINLIRQCHEMVRNIITELYNEHILRFTRILYGGSVNYSNAQKIIEIPNVDGLAVTRGALNPLDFINIIRLVEREAINRTTKG